MAVFILHKEKFADGQETKEAAKHRSEVRILVKIKSSAAGSSGSVFAFCSPTVYTVSVGKSWATVTVTDSQGRGHSVDVYACSTYDAVCCARESPPGSGLPRLTPDMTFEVSTGGKIHYVEGHALQRWILRERHERKGPAGLLFSQRPTLE